MAIAVMTGRSYTDLVVQDGGQASLEFLRVHFGGVPEEERRRVREQLEWYCGQDTDGMIWITDALRNVASGKWPPDPFALCHPADQRTISGSLT